MTNVIPRADGNARPHSRGLPAKREGVQREEDEGDAHEEGEDPGHDPRSERLVGYRIYRLVQGPYGTAPEQVFVTTVPEGTNRFDELFPQTFRYSTGGDLRGYIVEPIYESLLGQTQGQLFPGDSCIFYVGR